MIQQRKLREFPEVCMKTPRSKYDSRECGAWLFVLKFPFMLQEHLKMTKTDKKRFHFAKKKF